MCVFQLLMGRVCVWGGCCYPGPPHSLTHTHSFSSFFLCLREEEERVKIS